MKRKLRWIKSLGPGVITGAADDDPSGIATYSQTGAKYGTGMLWTALFMLPLMVSVQEMAARIGLVTQKGIIAVMKEHYSRYLVFAIVGLLLIANTINLAADLGAIAAAVQIIVPVSFPVIVLGTAFLIVLLEVLISYKNYAKFLKFLTFFLFAYVITGFLVVTDWKEILLASIWPGNLKFNFESILLLIGVVGTTISPYMMFWQANEEVEEEREKHISVQNKASNRLPSLILSMRFDTWAGMLFSEFATWFIIVTTAQTLHRNGVYDITTAAQAASALAPFAGEWAKLLFALGIVGTGLLAIPIFAGANAYAVSELFGWKEGLDRKYWRAKAFYAVIALSVVVGVLVNFIGINPISALVYAAIINGVISVPLIAVLMYIGNNKEVLKEHTNPTWVNIFGTVSLITMILAIVALFFTR